MLEGEREREVHVAGEKKTIFSIALRRVAYG